MMSSAIRMPKSFVFLGGLNSGNSYSSENILQDNFGNIFNTYHIYIENGARQGGPSGGGIEASGAIPFEFGLQLYINGSWVTTGYNYYLGGIHGQAGDNVTSSFWKKRLSGGNASSLVLSPAISTDQSLTAGCVIMDSRGPAMCSTNHSFQDFSAGIVGYTAQGLLGKPADSMQATGLRLFASDGAVIDMTRLGYFSVYGLSE